ncbi:MAG: DUF882 domain-containing protein [Brevinema sp.]
MDIKEDLLQDGKYCIRRGDVLSQISRDITRDFPLLSRLGENNLADNIYQSNKREAFGGSKDLIFADKYLYFPFIFKIIFDYRRFNSYDTRIDFTNDDKLAFRISEREYFSTLERLDSEKARYIQEKFKKMNCRYLPEAMSLAPNINFGSFRKELGEVFRSSSSNEIFSLAEIAETFLKHYRISYSSYQIEDISRKLIDENKFSLASRDDVIYIPANKVIELSAKCLIDLIPMTENTVSAVPFVNIEQELNILVEKSLKEVDGATVLDLKLENSPLQGRFSNMTELEHKVKKTNAFGRMKILFHETELGSQYNNKIGSFTIPQKNVDTILQRNSNEVNSLQKNGKRIYPNVNLEILATNWAMAKIYADSKRISIEEKVFSLSEAQSILQKYGSSLINSPKDASDLLNLVNSLAKKGIRAVDERLAIDSNHKVRSFLLKSVEEIVGHFTNDKLAFVEILFTNSDYTEFLAVTERALGQISSSDKRLEKLIKVKENLSLSGDISVLAKNYTLATIYATAHNTSIHPSDFNENQGKDILAPACSSILQNPQKLIKLLEFHKYVEDFESKNPPKRIEGISPTDPELFYNRYPEQKVPFSNPKTNSFTPTPFNWEEYTNSPTAKNSNIINIPDLRAISNLAEVHKARQEIERLLTNHLAINSGYRSPILNKAISNKNTTPSTNSSHMKGYAADIRIPANKHEEVMWYLRTNMTDTNRIKQGLPTINQAISYPLANTPFIHVDVNPNGGSRYNSNKRFKIDTNGTSVRYDFK